MKITTLFITFFTLASNFVFANVPFSATIDGPEKIGHGSVFKYKATLEGLDESLIFRVDWHIDPDFIHTTSGQYATVTSPTYLNSMVLECDVYVGYPDTTNSLLCLQASINVVLADPIFKFERENYRKQIVTDTSLIPIFGNVDYDGGGTVTDGASTSGFYDDELLWLQVDLLDRTLRVNRGNVKLSVPNDFRFWEYCYRDNLLADSGDDIEAALTDDLELVDALDTFFAGFVEAKDVKKNRQFVFSFNSEETLLPYLSCGLPNNSKPNNYNSIRNDVHNTFPILSDCQWRYLGEASSAHNRFAYAVVPFPPDYNIYNGKYFHANKTTPLVSNIYTLVSYNGVWATSLDSFGDRDGVFESIDAYYFFKSSVFGSHGLVSSINCQMIYYHSSFAAHVYQPNQPYSIMGDWVVFRARIGTHLIAFIVFDDSNISMKFGAPTLPL